MERGRLSCCKTNHRQIRRGVALIGRLLFHLGSLVFFLPFSMNGGKSSSPQVIPAQFSGRHGSIPLSRSLRKRSGYSTLTMSKSCIPWNRWIIVIFMDCIDRIDRIDGMDVIAFVKSVWNQHPPSIGSILSIRSIFLFLREPGVNTWDSVGAFMILPRSENHAEGASAVPGRGAFLLALAGGGGVGWGGCWSAWEEAFPGRPRGNPV